MQSIYLAPFIPIPFQFYAVNMDYKTLKKQGPDF